jgi:hypothetical protein
MHSRAVKIMCVVVCDVEYVDVSFSRQMSARGEHAAPSTGDLLCLPVSLLLGDGSSVVKDDDVAFVVWVVSLYCCENTEETDSH